MQSPRSSTIGHADVIQILGNLDDDEIIEIMAMNPTVVELEEAAVWARGDGDALARSGHPLSDTAAKIVDLLTADEEEPPPLGR